MKVNIVLPHIIISGYTVNELPGRWQLTCKMCAVRYELPYPSDGTIKIGNLLALENHVASHDRNTPDLGAAGRPHGSKRG